MRSLTKVTMAHTTSSLDWDSECSDEIWCLWENTSSSLKCASFSWPTFNARVWEDFAYQIRQNIQVMINHHLLNQNNVKAMSFNLINFEIYWIIKHNAKASLMHLLSSLKCVCAHSHIFPLIYTLPQNQAQRRKKRVEIIWKVLFASLQKRDRKISFVICV